MKKKQLEKLRKQFRPSFETARKQLFYSMEKQAKSLYDLSIRVYIKPTNQEELAIELLGETSKDQIVSVPLDENFDTVVRRIQSQEKGLLERFSSNLAEEVASYWLTTPTTTEEKTEELTEETVVEEVEVSTDVETTDTEEMTLATFIEQISNFPKFHVVEKEDEVQVYEKAAQERLLATVSMKEEATYSTETALERKYKLKLEVIPVIEAFANTKISNR